MGNPKGDWRPTRDPKRYAQIHREAEEATAKQAAIEAAYLKHLQAFRESRQDSCAKIGEKLGRRNGLGSPVSSAGRNR